MRLPNHNLAIVSEDKILGYMLNPLHSDGAGKAKFFIAHGFKSENWQEMAKSLKQIATENDVSDQIQSIYGVKYIIDGLLSCKSSNSPKVRTVWIIEADESIPRLVTAYPAGQGEN